MLAKALDTGQASHGRRYHIALSVPFDFAAFDKRAQADACPRHAMSSLQKELGANVIQPVSASIGIWDHFRAKAPGVGNANMWALARELARSLDGRDTILATGEDIGFTIATAMPRASSRAKLCVLVHNPDRPRIRYMFWRYRLRDRIDCFITSTRHKIDILQKKFGVPTDRLFYIEEQTDVRFFAPGSAGSNKPRPVIGSGGLEQRDYVTLAQATEDMDVDVRVCAMSPNATARADTFPKPIPENMHVGRHDWPELRQLYRDSDIVVVSTKENKYQAGLTTLFEAMACARPVIMTRADAPVDRLAQEGRIIAVPPADPAAMREAISDLLANPARAQQMAERGREAVMKGHTSERYVSDIVELLSKL